MNERDITIVKKIINYCNRAESSLKRYDNSYESFCNDYLFQDACCMCIIQIGELAGLLSDDMRTANSNVPWRVIKDTRNLYVHAYGTIDLALTWQTLQIDLPMLKKNCMEILEDIQLGG